MNILKKTLDGSKEKWSNVLPFILCAYRIMPHLAIRESPFALAFRMEVIVLVELKVSSARFSAISTK